MDKTFSPHKFLDALAEELIFNFARAGGGTTPGLVGSAREHEVRNKLQSVLPTKVAVATGCVIDSFGNTSNQCDVILYEKDHCPRVFHQRRPCRNLYPVRKRHRSW